jgi:[ribosomal protein S18]-alanine N-acetyltransferase
MSVRAPAGGGLMEDEAVEVLIAPLRRRHLRAVLQVEGQVYPKPWTLGVFLSELALTDTRCYVVARIGGKVVGYAGVMLNGDEAHVTTVAVDPRWHRHQVATRMLAVLVRVTVDKGFTAMTLEVRMGNTAAQSLYRRFGFAPGGVRKNYYPETNEDALIMWAHDVHGPDYAERLARLEAGVSGTTVVERLPGATGARS